jgi:hypothetical protein
MAHEQLRILAQALLHSIRSSATIDWLGRRAFEQKCGSKFASYSHGMDTHPIFKWQRLT